jgi:hypothetical protein
MTAGGGAVRFRARAAAVCAVVAVIVLVSPPLAYAGFPTRGVVVPGQSIGNVRLGMSEPQVRVLWGTSYKRCTMCGTGSLVWLYEYPREDPIGAAVKFSAAGRVVAVFTLGSPAGWGVKGLMMGDPVTNVYTLFGNTTSATNCIGYGALTVRIGSAATSFYSASGLIYGYALTAQNQSVCQ